MILPLSAAEMFLALLVLIRVFCLFILIQLFRCFLSSFGEASNRTLNSVSDFLVFSELCLIREHKRYEYFVKDI